MSDSEFSSFEEDGEYTLYNEEELLTYLWLFGSIYLEAGPYAVSKYVGNMFGHIPSK